MSSYFVKDIQKLISPQYLTACCLNDSTENWILEQSHSGCDTRYPSEARKPWLLIKSTRYYLLLSLHCFQQIWAKIQNSSVWSSLFNIKWKSSKHFDIVIRKYAFRIGEGSNNPRKAVEDNGVRSPTTQQVLFFSMATNPGLQLPLTVSYQTYMLHDSICFDVY